MRTEVNLVLLYQAGIANVIDVVDFVTIDAPVEEPGRRVSKDELRSRKPVFQGDFRSAEMFVTGAYYCGAAVRVAFANVAGDATGVEWRGMVWNEDMNGPDVGGVPFSDAMRLDRRWAHRIEYDLP